MKMVNNATISEVFRVLLEMLLHLLKDKNRANFRKIRKPGHGPALCTEKWFNNKVASAVVS